MLPLETIAKGGIIAVLNSSMRLYCSKERDVTGIKLIFVHSVFSSTIEFSDIYENGRPSLYSTALKLSVSEFMNEDEYMSVRSRSQAKIIRLPPNYIIAHLNPLAL